MKPLLLVLCLIPFVACGGSSSPEDQVRGVAKKTAEALTSDHPERACQYMVDHDACAGGAVLAKSMKLEVSALVGLPEDWNARLAKAKITVRGDVATVSGFKPSTYLLRDGHWLIDNR